MCRDRLRDFLRGQYGIEASDGGTQVLWRQVGIAHCHRQGAVAEEVFQLGQGRAPDEQPGLKPRRLQIRTCMLPRDSILTTTRLPQDTPRCRPCDCLIEGRKDSASGQARLVDLLARRRAHDGVDDVGRLF